MKGWLAGILLAGTSVLLAGCFFPQDRKAENQIPYDQQITTVQQAVDQFQEATGGLLPIKTKEMDTPVYEKYPIDFSKLTPQYLASPPGNAYESGGVFQYVLIDVEDNPKVKVFDLRVAEKISEMKRRIQAQGYPPFKDKIADNIYTLDQAKLGYKEEQFIPSPYTNSNLPFIITGKGEIYVDYITDLYQALQSSDSSFTSGDDIREILHKDSPVVPAFSLPYTIDKNNEPVYMTK